MSLYPTEKHRKKTVFISDKPSLTEQCHGDQVKIQNIMTRYHKTGVIDHVRAHQGTYMDIATAPEFHEAMNIIAEATGIFESLPVRLRAEFQNDPATFIEFMQDERNRVKIEEYGLDASHLPEATERPPEENTENPSQGTPEAPEHPRGEPVASDDNPS